MRRHVNPRFTHRARYLLVCVVVCSAIFAALVPVGAKAEPPATLTLGIENDFFKGTDRHYTNGFSLAGSWEIDDPDTLARLIAGKIFAPGDKTVLAITLGHQIFTPQDTDRDDLLRADRPYAGWAFVNFTLQRMTNGGGQESAGIDVGVVGEAAMARRVQNGFHRLINVSQSQGWQHQLHDEPGMNFIYDRRWRFGAPGTSGALGWDILPHIGASMGNVHTYAALGGVIRIGTDLDQDPGPLSMRPAVPGSAYFGRARSFGWIVYAGIDGRFVARNIFLDGNSYKNSHRVKRRPWVGDVLFGLSLRFNAFRVTASQTFRSKEFDGQNGTDRYGSLSFSWRF